MLRVSLWAYVMLNYGSDDRDYDDDDEGWITPGNVEAMKQATVALTQSEYTDLPVACVTTDYAMQVWSFLQSLD